MTFLNLEYFVEVASSLNLTKSASRLHITQQSLSNHIHKLEQYYDTTLFQRSPALRLTEAGELLEKRARELLKAKACLDREMLCFLQTGSQTLTLATNGGNLNYLPEFLIQCRDKAPGIKLVVTEADAKGLIQEQIPDNVDIIFGYLPFAEDTTEYVALRPDPLAALVPDAILESVFPGRTEAVKAELHKPEGIRLMAQCPFIMPGYRDKLRKIIEDMFARAGVEPNIVFTANTVENAVSMCLGGLGITIGSEHYMRRYDPRLSTGIPAEADIYPIMDELAVGTLALGWHKNRKKTQSFREFIEIAKDFFA